MAENDFNISFKERRKKKRTSFISDVELSNAVAVLEKKKGKYTLTRPVTEDEIINAVKYLLLSKHLQHKQFIGDAAACKNYLQIELANCENEVFCAIFLDTTNRVLAFEKLFIGSVNNAIIYPREVVRKALHHNAAAVIFAHNHPSGSTTASKSDIELTKNLTKTLMDVDVKVLDHFIIGSTGVFSLMGGWPHVP